VSLCQPVSHLKPPTPFEQSSGDVHVSDLASRQVDSLPMRVGGNRRVREALGFLETFNWLTVRMALQRKKAMRSLPGLTFRNYVALGGRAAWKSAELTELFPEVSGCRIEMEYLAGEGIASSIEELAIMALLTAATQPRVIFEIGTFRGRTALNFALNSPPDAIVYTLDLPLEERSAVEVGKADSIIMAKSDQGIDYKGKPGSGKISELQGNSLSFDFSPYHAAVDLFLVDGAHHYEAARSDTLNALRCVRPGGVILWHDFANYGEYNDVTRAILEYAPSARQIGSTQLAVLRVR
jgi:hypothetical protein